MPSSSLQDGTQLPPAAGAFCEKARSAKNPAAKTTAIRLEVLIPISFLMFLLAENFDQHSIRQFAEIAKLRPLKLLQ
jgi:hypothetical protein